MSLKIIAIALNALLLIMFGSYFIGHGLPNNPILWTSTTLWLVVPLVNRNTHKTLIGPSS
jgi:hypothetical protein